MKTCARCMRPFVRDVPHVQVLVTSPLDAEPAYVYFHGMCHDEQVREHFGLPKPRGEYGLAILRRA